MGLPASFRSAKIHGVLPMDPAAPRAAFALDMDDGSVLRVHLSPQDAHWLVSALRDEWPQGLKALCACQSPTPGKTQEAA